MEKEPIYGKGLLKSINDAIKINKSDNKARYKTCIIISKSGKPAFGMLYESLWDQVSVGDEVNFAISLLADNKTLLPSITGLSIQSLSYEDFGAVAPTPVVEDDMENPFS